MYEYHGVSGIPYDRINEFMHLIINPENLNEDYLIEGTNITIKDLLTMENVYSDENKKR